MSVSAAQMTAFFNEVITSQVVWTICDEQGFPAPMTSAGQRSMPFWSQQSRAQRIIETVSAYQGFAVYRLSLQVFVEKWLPGLKADDTLVGINWSGIAATGYDLTPDEVMARMESKQIKG
ncbi:DUF2750 domain-containing protein [Asticcacaulis excentricus]|uniref:DUF2750 domain-containing protein n=1 Tax=Asticcacaulis excentricus TaxID=78587 RepID=UPI000F81DA3B|nr:DUF2750 domain-containing protein [Asticcacaulis excentricus]